MELCGHAGLQYWATLLWLWLARRPLHHPVNIRIVRRGDIQTAQSANRRHRPSVFPPVNFRMAIGKRQTAGSGMVARREINQDPLLGLVRPAIHTCAPLPVINAV